jgi:hypothetical protein
VVYRNVVHESCARGAFTAIPASPSLENKRLETLVLLEETIVLAAKRNGVTDDMQKQFDKYEKLKAMALKPGSTGEERTAFRMAVLEAVKMAF